jgi:hypothetical protein
MRKLIVLALLALAVAGGGVAFTSNQQPAVQVAGCDGGNC